MFSHDAAHMLRYIKNVPKMEIKENQEFVIKELQAVFQIYVFGFVFEVTSSFTRRIIKVYFQTWGSLSYTIITDINDPTHGIANIMTSVSNKKLNSAALTVFP